MLYNKYRSALFSDVVGQKHITEGLRKKAELEKIPHALLFVGIRGIGKTSVAKIFAKAINCHNPQNGEPCNECKSCLDISKEASIDYHEIDAASNNSVENIRQIKKDVQHQPLSKFKVYILDEVHMLSTGAFNALLKTLEEPPNNVIFILATTEFHKIPATILSRCQIHTFKRITTDDICGRLMYILKQEEVGYNEDAIRIIAEQADGSMRDAISILDACIEPGTTITLEAVKNQLGIISYERIGQLLDAILNIQIVKALSTLEALYNDGIDLTYIVQSIIKLIKDCMRYKVSKSSLSASKEYLDLVSKLSDSSNVGTFTKMLDELNELKKGEIIVLDLESFIIKKFNNVSSSAEPLNHTLINEDIKKMFSKMEVMYKEIQNTKKNKIDDEVLKLKKRISKLEEEKRGLIPQELENRIEKLEKLSKEETDVVINEVTSNDVKEIISDFKKPGINQSSFDELEYSMFIEPLEEVSEANEHQEFRPQQKKDARVNDTLQYKENIVPFNEITSEKESRESIKTKKISLIEYVEKLKRNNSLEHFISSQNMDISIDEAANKIELMTSDPTVYTVLLAMKQKKSELLQYNEHTNFEIVIIKNKEE